MVTSYMYILISRSSFSWLHITLLREKWFISTDIRGECSTDDDVPAYGMRPYVTISYNRTPYDQTSDLTLNLWSFAASGAVHLIGNLVAIYYVINIANQSINKSISQSIHRSIDRSIDRSVHSANTKQWKR